MGYKKFVLETARAPFMLGMHWFFWMDYPKQDETEGGFLPDENVGLVTNDESRTYEELAEWIRKTNREVHSVHETAHVNLNPEPVLTRRTLKHFTPKLDGDISEWPQETAVRPSGFTSLRNDASFDHTYFFSHDGDALYVAGEISDSHLEHPGGEWAWTGDCLFLHFSPAKPYEFNAFQNLSIFIYPGGSGPAKDEPRAVRWYGPEESKVIPSTIVKRTRVGGLSIEAKIPWSSLGGSRPWRSYPWKMRVGYQNANEISLAYWLGIVRLQAK